MSFFVTSLVFNLRFEKFMNASHKFSEFLPPSLLFSETKGKQKVSKYVYNPIHTFLRKIERISEILQKSVWSDLRRHF